MIEYDLLADYLEVCQEEQQDPNRYFLHRWNILHLIINIKDDLSHLVTERELILNISGDDITTVDVYEVELPSKPKNLYRANSWKELYWSKDPATTTSLIVNEEQDIHRVVEHYLEPYIEDLRSDEDIFSIDPALIQKEILAMQQT